MIRYALVCSGGHRFDGWFGSASVYDRLRAAGQVACTICGTGEVDKALMAPAVVAETRAPEPATPGPGPGPLAAPTSDLEQAMAALRRHIESTSDYVGLNFAAEARRMHAGDAPERPIYGETRGDEARKLIEEGVPVAPLPFLPTRKTN